MQVKRKLKYIMAIYVGNKHKFMNYGQTGWISFGEQHLHKDFVTEFWPDGDRKHFAYRREIYIPDF